MVKQFTLPKNISPFYNHTKVTRKFKKKWSHILQGDKYKYLTLNQKLWYILGLTNPKYRDFIISEICKKN